MVQSNAGPTPGLAQEDNTGTNPVNFTYDARFITEVAEFADGGGSLITNTFEFRWPLGRNVANVKIDDQSPPSFRLDIEVNHERIVNLSYNDQSLPDIG